MSAPQSFRQLIGISPSSVRASAPGTALIVIDAQGTYAPDGGLAITGVAESQKVIAQLVDRFRSADAPVIWIQHSAGSGAPVFNPDNSSFDFIGDERPVAGEKVIIKQAPSSFTGTDLLETLQAKKITQVVLTGYMSHVCVSSTARVAFESGLDVVVVRDAVGDRDIPGAEGVLKAAKLVETVLDELADAFATVVDSRQVMA